MTRSIQRVKIFYCNRFNIGFLFIYWEIINNNLPQSMGVPIE